MRSVVTLFLMIGVLIVFGSVNHSNAQENEAPPQNAGPLRPARGAVRPPVTPKGEVHTNVADKPCLAYEAFSRPHLVATSIFDYVVAVTNKCPTSIRIRICLRDGTGCNGAFVQAYRNKEVVMGSGPATTFFDYIAKEAN